MIRWIIEKYQVEISLDVNDCETYATMKFRSLSDTCDKVESVKEQMIGLHCPRYGSIDSSYLANAFDLSCAVEWGFQAYRPKLIEGAEIYANYKPRPSTPGKIY
jgi:hypothetical protein